jgi:hypothetical protein
MRRNQRITAVEFINYIMWPRNHVLSRAWPKGVITMPANVGEMFYFGEVPWHGLGKYVAQPATLEEALEFGGLNWEVGRADLMTAESPPSIVTKRKALIRLDRAPGEAGRVLGVAHRGFAPIQNREAGLLFDAIFGHQKQVYHTGDTLAMVR